MAKTGMRATVVTLLLQSVLLQAQQILWDTLTTAAPQDWKRVTLFDEELDTEGQLTVSKDSPYCNWKTVMGPICNFNETDQVVVVVPPGLSLSAGQLELEVHGAKVVHVFPTCVSWIQVFTAGLVNTFPSQDAKDCRTWLRIYNSKVDTVAYGVKDLTIVDCQVNSINLVDQRDFMAINSTINSIDALEWEGYRGTILNTTVLSVSNIIAKDSWHILESHLGFIATGGITFYAREMSVINTTISHMAPHALTIVIGAVSFTNVTIEILEMNAIIMTTPVGFLSMTNVTITSALAPCFVLPDKDRISLTNVTIQGTPLNVSSSYFKFRDDELIKANVSNIQIETLTESCSSNGTTLTCDLSNVNRTVEVRGAGVKNYRILDFHNCRALKVISLPCGTELRLNATSAALSRVFPVISEDSTSCSINLTVRHSKLNVVSVAHISTMNVSHSIIRRLHGGQLDNLMMENVTVEEVDGVVVAGVGGYWHDVNIGSLFNLTIAAPVVAENLRLREKLGAGSLTVKHPNETSVLRQTKVSRLDRRSLVVTRGSNLVLSDTLGLMAAKDAIILEENASLKVVRPTFLLPTYGIISAVSRNQVTVQEPTSPSMVHVRAPALFVGDVNNLTVTNVHSSPFCRKVLLFDQICNFSSAPEGEVIVDLTDGQFNHRTVVTFAASVLIYPSCIEKLILMDVVNATTVDNGRDCQTWLEATGVHFTNITSGVLDVTLTKCTVDLLSPDRTLRDVDLEDSTVAKVSGVHWTGFTGIFNNSKLGQVEGMQAGSRMIMANCTVGTLLAGGLTIEAEGIISNSTIQNVMAGGITIKKLSHIQDVTFGTLAKGAIVVTDGLLLLSNVTIEVADEASIVAHKNGGVSFNNVTVSGKAVHWLGYLADPLVPRENSLVFLNKYFNDGNKSVSSVASTTPSKPTTTSTTSTTTSTTSTSSSSLRHTTKSPEIIPSLVTPDMLVASGDSSWKWAVAGIGFFVGLLAGCCIFIAVKVVKPNKGRLLMPTVFWKVKDDHHELLQEEQPGGELMAIRRDQGYRSVPGSDVF
ncbi:uncharacterized protein [Procambarus clarkii]|uniref:uncharacterized protein n=1 Tax=Procambarus clarkii TaxID=6728 RepID=UPI00374419E6